MKLVNSATRTNHPLSVIAHKDVGTDIAGMHILSNAARRRNDKPGRDWLWTLARAYAALTRLVKKRTGRHIKGLGFLLRRVETNHVFEAHGYHWFLDHRIADTYAALLRHSSNEPETHQLLRFVADGLGEPFVFVDVGAHIGEMVVPMAAHPRNRRAIAFEPHPVCAEACRKNFELNQLEDIEFYEVVVADGTLQSYVLDRASSESGIRNDAVGILPVETVRLDDQLQVKDECMLLIDVEGAELAVMKGGAAFIARQRPLIIFEYHAGTRSHFQLHEVSAVLGDGYQLYRLRKDGYLDRTLSDTWNCVAVHEASLFAPICRQRVVD